MQAEDDVLQHLDVRAVAINAGDALALHAWIRRCTAYAMNGRRIRFSLNSILRKEQNDRGRETFMSRPARYLLGTIIVGILVLFLCALALRRPPATDPFDHPAAPSDAR
jgi:hypothetical protein